VTILSRRAFVFSRRSHLRFGLRESGACLASAKDVEYCSEGDHVDDRVSFIERKRYETENEPVCGCEDGSREHCTVSKPETLCVVLRDDRK
jgi:hypothetical protein